LTTGAITNVLFDEAEQTGSPPGSRRVLGAVGHQIGQRRAKMQRRRNSAVPRCRKTAESNRILWSTYPERRAPVHKGAWRVASITLNGPELMAMFPARQKKHAPATPVRRGTFHAAL